MYYGLQPEIKLSYLYIISHINNNDNNYSLYENVYLKIDKAHAIE